MIILYDPVYRPAVSRFDELYVLEQQVGEGSFGNVYRAHAKSHGAHGPVAVKVFTLKASCDAKVGQESRQKLTSFFSECAGLLDLGHVEQNGLSEAMLSRLDHPHVVRMHESFQSATELHLVLELCPGGELYTLLVKKIERRSNILHRKRYRSLADKVMRYHEYIYIYIIGTMQ